MKKWFAMLRDGTIVDEEEVHWSNVSDQVDTLGFNIDGQVIELPRLESYVQAKTASANLDGSGMQIESRYIGGKLGNNTIIIRVDEKTNHINLEIQ